MQETVTVRDVMSREYLGVSEGDTLDDVLDLMLQESVASVVVVRGEDPVGLVTEQELLELVAAGESIEEQQVGTVMRAPPEPITADRHVSAALDALANSTEGELPVINGGQELVGVVTESDLLTASASLFSADNPASPQTEPEDDIHANAHGTEPFGTDNDRHAGTPEAEPAESYSTQSVCESCGGLAELADVNGQLLCPECRDV